MRATPQSAKLQRAARRRQPSQNHAAMLSDCALQSCNTRGPNAMLAPTAHVCKTPVGAKGPKLSGRNSYARSGRTSGSNPLVAVAMGSRSAHLQQARLRAGLANRTPTSAYGHGPSRYAEDLTPRPRIAVRSRGRSRRLNGSTSGKQTVATPGLACARARARSYVARAGTRGDDDRHASAPTAHYAAMLQSAAAPARSHSRRPQRLVGL